MAPKIPPEKEKFWKCKKLILKWGTCTGFASVEEC